MDQSTSRLTTKLKAERIQEKLKAERIQEKLKAERIQQRLALLPGWQATREGSALRRAFELPTIRAATAFVSLVAEIGEAAGFIPVIRMHYLEVTLVIDTDRKAGLTDLDFDLAEVFDLCT